MQTTKTITMKRSLGVLALALAATGGMYADNLAYITTATKQFGTIDLDTGVFTQLGAHTVKGAGLAVAGGRLYTADYQGSYLYHLDPANGRATKIAQSGIIYEAFGSTLRGLYAFDDSFNLYSVNPKTAAVKLIGPTGIPPGNVQGVSGISTNTTALYFASNEILYVLDTCTGAATQVGTLSAGGGLTALVYEGGTLYGYTTSVIYSVDPTSAAETVVSNTSGSPAPTEIFGLAPSVLADFEPSRLDFGPQTTKAEEVTITNRGVDPMKISEIKTSGDFSQTNNCGRVLTADASCTVTVTFTPTRSGIRAGMLTVGDGSGSHPRTLTLTGEGQ